MNGYVDGHKHHEHVDRLAWQLRLVQFHGEEYCGEAHVLSRSSDVEMELVEGRPLGAVRRRTDKGHKRLDEGEKGRKAAWNTQYENGFSLRKRTKLLNNFGSKERLQ